MPEHGDAARLSVNRWNENDERQILDFTDQDDTVLSSRNTESTHEAHAVGTQVHHQATVSPFNPSKLPYPAPKGIIANPAPEEHSQALLSSALLPAIDPLAIASAGDNPSHRVKAKNGQAKNPFIPQWYTTENIYSGSTLYNKVGRSQMEAFLAGEGVNIAEKFPKGHFPKYIQKGSKRVKINRGEALIDLVNIVHQRVLDRRNMGFLVGPNKAPQLGAEDWEAQISAFDSERGTGIVANRASDAFEGNREQTRRANGVDQTLAAGGPDQSAQVNVQGNMPGAAVAAFAPFVLVPPAPRYIEAPYHDWPNFAATQRLGEPYRDHIHKQDGINSRLEIRAMDNGENSASASHNLEGDKIVQHAQAKTAEIQRLIRDRNGHVIISAEVQRLVRQIIDAAILYVDIERRFKEKIGNKAALVKEGRDARNDYHRSRSDLMQRLAADVSWDSSVLRGGYKVAEVVLEVLPVKPHEALK